MFSVQFEVDGRVCSAKVQSEIEGHFAAVAVSQLFGKASLLDGKATISEYRRGKAIGKQRSN